jgi:hypothetical protein
MSLLLQGPGKIVPVLNEPPRPKAHGGGGFKTPRILNFATSWRRVISLTPRSLYPWVQSPRWYSFNSSLGVPHSRSDPLVKRIISYRRRNRKLFFGCSVCKLIAVPTEIFWLFRVTVLNSKWVLVGCLYYFIYYIFRYKDFLWTAWTWS